ncbi:NUDIX domain-containing protein [Alisedimentitalea sp. MJ-SS2]|uniref:NUDIX domain-containing protein n=1 Tax=Aliisedimentitalea sp. MJ-SS2 TaxID=3049795 RepID=UPI0029156C73|nr:NUDIX domain-containing protein [Alisedimentitalea sp. MJ-SS2]MDU8928498.1 NUDIX domain-containing protein [Alisedimentitalea sp. MJ-SS2]
MSGFRDIGVVPETVIWRGAGMLAHDEQGRVLMHLRDDLPGVAAPGLWSCFGGEVEPGETLEQAAKREFLEETGVDVSGDVIRPLCRFATIAHGGGVLHVFQLERPVAAQDIRLGEGAGFAFLNRDQLARFPLIANLRQAFSDLGFI